jgi:eukaryotic-like serine/threonine-protein kinase
MMVAEAARRTAWLCLATAAFVPAILVTQRWAQPALAASVLTTANRLLALGMVLWAIGLYFLHRYRVVGPSTVVRLGIALQLFGAFVISMLETSIRFNAGQPVPGVSTLAVWIFAFGVLLPNRPSATLLWGAMSAATWPLAYAINAAMLDVAVASWRMVAVWPLFNGGMAAVSYLIARQTYGAKLAADPASNLGSYRLVERIGEGGMGEVWAAEHQILARKAAIKLIRPQGSSGQDPDVAVGRFQREAQAIASLQSPHTVYLYDFGVSHDGRLYYAMELLDGLSLEALVTSFGPQPAARVVRILMQVCNSLEEAHHQGLVHRDLKPSNVMLCKVALTHDVVKVLDFGLAKFTRSTELSQLTRVGTATGTPGYIAPEVAIGESSIDGRADIYSLGCVAYFLLTGAQVFDDRSPIKLAIQHVREMPVPPSARTTLPIPDALERIVLHCLAKAPADRPRSAAVVRTMLDTCPVARWTDEDAEAWWYVHRSSTFSPGTSPGGPAAPSPIIRKYEGGR